MALSSGYTRSFDGAHALYIDANIAAQTKTNAFNDVISGKDGNCGGSYLCEAREGYDGPSGLGTLNGVPEIPPPVVESKPASEVASAEATLNATVDPNGPTIVTCEFEYGTSTSYGATVPCLEIAGLRDIPRGGFGATHQTDFEHHLSLPHRSGHRRRNLQRRRSVLHHRGERPATAVGAHRSILGSGTDRRHPQREGRSQRTAGHLVRTSNTAPPARWDRPRHANPNPARAPRYVSVSATVTGLAEDTTYYYRVDGLQRGRHHPRARTIVHDARSSFRSWRLTPPPKCHRPKRR